MNTLAQDLDIKATQLAKDYLRTEGELLEVLMRMRRDRLFAPLGFISIFDYCERKLGLSRAQAFYFKSVAEKAQEVPQIKEAVQKGDISLSQARRIVPVITQDNHCDWIAKAKTLSQQELEQAVTAVNPKAHPREKIRPLAPDLSELKVGIDSKTQQSLKALQEILSQKLGKPASLADVVAWATQVCREKYDPVEKAKRARQFPRGNAWPDKTGRRPLPAYVKHAVVKRDQAQCTFVASDGRRCQQKRWLALHHVVEVARGGTNTVENLRTLCQAHHRLIHSPGVRPGSRRDAVKRPPEPLSSQPHCARQSAPDPKNTQLTSSVI